MPGTLYGRAVQRRRRGGRAGHIARPAGARTPSRGAALMRLRAARLRRQAEPGTTEVRTPSPPGQSPGAAESTTPSPPGGALVRPRAPRRHREEAPGRARPTPPPPCSPRHDRTPTPPPPGSPRHDRTPTPSLPGSPLTSPTVRRRHRQAEPGTTEGRMPSPPMQSPVPPRSLHRLRSARGVGRHQRTGRVLTPRMSMPGSHSPGSPSRVRPGARFRRVPRAMPASRRARGAPRQ